MVIPVYQRPSMSAAPAGSGEENRWLSSSGHPFWGVLASEPKASSDPFIDMALAARETAKVKFGSGSRFPRRIAEEVLPGVRAMLTEFPTGER
jgi:hypothetical protein